MSNFFFTVFISLLVFNFKNYDSVEISKKSDIDSTIISYDTTTISSEQYKAFVTADYKMYVVNSKGDTVFKKPDSYVDFVFTDFNTDGFNDILIHRISNVPGIQELILFDSVKKCFIIVKGFERFPDPKSIQGTKYFFSYHRSGCADNFWDSDLFSIDNFETHLLGNISGNECEGNIGIVVSKIVENKKKVFETFKVDTLESYNDRKWEFISDYWKNNYLKFIQ